MDTAPVSASVSDAGDEDYVSVPLVDAEGRNMAQVREVVIAVMGITGAGKSTLIKQITGQDVEIGDGLEACTSFLVSSVVTRIMALARVG
jgi:predicted GTPase